MYISKYVTTHTPTQKPRPFTNLAVQLYFAAVKTQIFLQIAFWGSNVKIFTCEIFAVYGIPLNYTMYTITHSHTEKKLKENYTSIAAQNA